MKKVLLTLLSAIVVLGLFAAVGFTGYRFGYARGIAATADGNVPPPQIGSFDAIRPNRMPLQRFDFYRGFHRGFGMDGFVRGGIPGMGFGFFALWGLLWRIALLALVIWFVYWLFTRSGWQLTRTQATSTVETQQKPAETATQEQNHNPED